MNEHEEHLIGGPKGCLKPNITTVNGGSPKLGPGSSIHGDKCWPGPRGPLGIPPKIKNTKVRCVAVGNIMYEPLVEGNVYLVYRKHEQTGEPTYSLCVYKNGNWIPYGLDQYIGNIQGFTGIPVMDDDYWVCANTAFADGEMCNIEFEEPTVEPEQEPEKHNQDEDSNEETVQEYVKRRHTEIAKEEEEEHRKAKEDKMRREMAGEPIPCCMPITPSPESQAIRNLNITIEILMEYIQKMKDGIIGEPVVEQNWEHLKNFTNQLLDRILELEKRMDNMPITLPGNPLPYQPYPYVPASPNTPLTPGYPTPPSIPEWPAWPPYGPIISYSLPGGINVTSTVSGVGHITGQK